MEFYQFYNSFGVLFTIVLMIFALNIKGRTKLTFLALQLCSLVLQGFSLYKVEDYRKEIRKPHYKVGLCYARTITASEQTVTVTAMVIHKTETAYAFSFYSPDNKVFLMSPTHPDQESFGVFEVLFPNAVDCPNAPTQLIN